MSVRVPFLLLGAFALALAFPAAATTQTREVRRAVPAKDGMLVEVENLVGRVTLERSSGAHVRYQGQRVTIVSRRRANAPTLYADFHVRVPQGVGVRLRNSVGLVTGGDVKGPLTVESDAGDVRLRGIAGRTTIRTGSGDVSL